MNGETVILPAIAGSWPPPVGRYAFEIARVSEQLGGGLSVPINPMNIDWIRAHIRGEHEDPLLQPLGTTR